MSHPLSHTAIMPANAPQIHPAIPSLLDSIRLGEPRIHEGIGLWPVLAEARPEPVYITLVEALSQEGFKITEVSEGIPAAPPRESR
jgi:hypothetical protein